MIVRKELFLYKLGKHKLYQCPKCAGNVLDSIENFCHHCGEKLEFEKGE
jgi:hypothetical protein